MGNFLLFLRYNIFAWYFIIFATIVASIIGASYFIEYQPEIPCQLKSTSDVYSYAKNNDEEEKQFNTIKIGKFSSGTNAICLGKRGNWYKLKFKNGDIGWVEGGNIAPNKFTVVQDDEDFGGEWVWYLYKSPELSDSLRITGISPGDSLTRLFEFKKTDSRSFEKVKTPDGDEGWIVDKLPERVGVRFQYSPKEFIINFTEVNSKLIGYSVDSLVSEFGLPSAIQKSNNNQSILFYSNINLYDSAYVAPGVKLKLLNGSVAEINEWGEAYVTIPDLLPMASFFRIIPFANIIRNLDPFEFIKIRGGNQSYFLAGFWDDIVYSILWLIFFIIYLLVFMLPTTISTLIAEVLAKNPAISNKMLQYVVIPLSLILGYFWYLIIIFNVNPFRESVFIYSALYIPILLSGFSVVSGVVSNRCPKCRAYNSFGEKTSYDGKNISETKYKEIRTDGSYEEATGNVVHNTLTTKYFTDHRNCHNCGFRWNIKRSISESKSSKGFEGR